MDYSDFILPATGITWLSTNGYIVYRGNLLGPFLVNTATLSSLTDP